MTTPIALYRGVERYIIAAGRTCRSNVGELIEGQAAHLVASFVQIPMSREHVTEVLEALAEPGCLFTAAQRQEMHKVLTTLVQAPRVSPKAQKKYVTQQDNSHLEEYPTDDLWSKLFDKTVSLRDKWQLWADFLTNVLGCRNPNELTRVRAVAITHVASGMQVAPEVAHAHVEEMRTQMEI